MIDQQLLRLEHPKSIPPNGWVGGPLLTSAAASRISQYSRESSSLRLVGEFAALAPTALARGQMALRRELPEDVSPAQVRSALDAVIRRTLGAPARFDKNGWLQIGLARHQPALAEKLQQHRQPLSLFRRITSAQFRVSDPFWSEASADWTTRKAWSGQDLKADHALCAGSH